MPLGSHSLHSMLMIVHSMSLWNHGYLMINRAEVFTFASLIAFMTNQSSSSYAMSEPFSDKTHHKNGHNH